MKKIAIFASGNGTNAQRIIEYFADHPVVKVDLVLSNNPDAFVLKRVTPYHIPTLVFTRDEFYHSSKILDILQERNIDFIVLAGFLWLIPGNLLEEYSDRIINIHPALLPKFGGKGMFGLRVHEAVLNSKQSKSGITIHLVNETYDDGQIIFQEQCDVEPSDTPESLAAKIHALEHEYYPVVIEALLHDPEEEDQ
ncbi:MAG: phosphoribosylglycinamide formyltransferase [Bacteroidetes bacterium]|nr:phosphoribosylglycinamide formyltransferase [Bacteroidota bacterium]